jgi:predicted GNAT family N-acyltransferase
MELNIRYKQTNILSLDIGLYKVEKKEYWSYFSKYHYLKNTIPTNNQMYVVTINNELASCISIGVFPHPQRKDIMKISRVVVLPKFQGLGLCSYMLEKMKNIYNEFDVRITTSLPHMFEILKNNGYYLKSQQIRNHKEVKETAKISHNFRKNYMETWSLTMKGDLKVKTINIKKEEKKNYLGNLIT